MADKEKKVTNGSSVEKATTEESKAAAKVAKAAKGSKKTDKPSFFARASKGTKRFFKDFKGESKKIVWPDAKTVLKSTGVVLVVVAIVALVVWGIDQGLAFGVQELKELALGDEITTTLADGETTTEHDHDHDHDHDEDEADEKKDSEEETSEAESTTESTTEATTEAEATAEEKTEE